MTARLLPLLLLLGSIVFMTSAWYGHLKYNSSPLLLAILASWGIAFLECILMVPANRLGSTVYTVMQLKTIQEILTLLVVAGFPTWYLGQPLKWNHDAAFALIVGAAFLMFYEPASATA